MIAAFREALYLVTNFIICAVVFTAWNVYVKWPRLDGPNEAFVDIALTIIYYLPIAYLVTYLPLRLTVFLLTSHPSVIRRLSARLSGFLLGVALALISTQTELFSHLNPILKFMGL